MKETDKEQKREQIKSLKAPQTLRELKEYKSLETEIQSYRASSLTHTAPIYVPERETLPFSLVNFRHLADAVV